MVRKKASRGYELKVVKTYKAMVLHIITKEAFFFIKITVISHAIKELSFIVTYPCEVTFSVFYYFVFLAGQDVDEADNELHNSSSCCV